MPLECPLQNAPGVDVCGPCTCQNVAKHHLFRDSDGISILTSQSCCEMICISRVKGDPGKTEPSYPAPVLLYLPQTIRTMWSFDIPAAWEEIKKIRKHLVNGFIMFIWIREIETPFMPSINALVILIIDEKSAVLLNLKIGQFYGNFNHLLH